MRSQDCRLTSSTISFAA
ncbi:hypothetical protein LINGRAHAP2_LOCUS6396 [Linum grandiflorum]